MIERINYVIAMIIYFMSMLILSKNSLHAIYWILVAIFLVVAQLLVRSMK
ncbi:MAG: hypothetical protein K2M17_05610 [Bacilli bacterium]|nr:hypothetical protein [Bacilli bacterium]